MFSEHWASASGTLTAIVSEVLCMLYLVRFGLKVIEWNN